MSITLKAGDTVRKIRPFDGSRFAGQPFGKSLVVLAIHDLTTHSIAILNDKTWEPVWNLHLVSTEVSYYLSTIPGSIKKV